MSLGVLMTVMLLGVLMTFMVCGNDCCDDARLSVVMTAVMFMDITFKYCDVC